MNSRQSYCIFAVLTIGVSLARPELGRCGEPMEEAQRLVATCQAQIDQGRYEDAERTGLKLRRLVETQMTHRPGGLGIAYDLLGTVYGRQRRYALAEPLLEQAIAIRRRAFPPSDPNYPAVAASLNNLSIVLKEQGRFTAAEPLAQEALKIFQSRLPPAHPAVTGTLGNLAKLRNELGKYTEAESLYRQLVETLELAHGPESLEVADAVNSVGSMYLGWARFSEAEKYYQRALAIREKKLGAGHTGVAKSLSNLAVVYAEQGKYAEAEPLHLRAVSILETKLGREDPEVAGSLNNLAELHRDQGRYAEAEPLYQRALAILERAHGSNHPDVAMPICNLGAMYTEQGKTALAESSLGRALAIFERAFGPNHRLVADCVNNLANLRCEEGRFADAEMLQKRVLEIREKLLGPEHPDVARSLDNLGSTCTDLHKYAEAEPLHRRALAIFAEVLGSESSEVATTLGKLAVLFWAKGELIEAEQFAQRALATREKAQGPDHPNVVFSLNNLALLCKDQERYADAERHLDRAAAIWERAATRPAPFLTTYWQLAQVYWMTNRREKAVAALQEALKAAEWQRSEIGKEEYKRAGQFGRTLQLYELMVQWQSELGNLDECLRTMERSRAKSLLEQMDARGVDLMAGVPGEQAEGLRRAEREALTRLASLRQQLEVLASRQDISETERKQQQESLRAQMRPAHDAYRSARADVRNASPAYQLAVDQERQPVSLETLQKWAADQQALVLEYLFGDKASYVLIVSPDEAVRVEQLTANDAQSQALKVDAGPLTVERVLQILRTEKRTGILDRLQTRGGMGKDKVDMAPLTALSELLIPERERAALLAGKYRRLVVMPDAPLSSLPFESLVVRSSGELKWLLDLAPSIQYAPSATILWKLAERQTRNPPQEYAVLTVGDCKNGRPPLPFSKREASWVADVFNRKTFSVAFLTGGLATEVNVRDHLNGRWLVHFACHGLVDPTAANLLGSLALTSSAVGNDPSNDGYLQLGEIYELKLDGCELAVLSACDTNVGPEQRGEGNWAISRGFLVAGARRVVASSWEVDDEAAASLVSYFCSILAKEVSEGRTPDYAAALQQAKRWLRAQEKWQSPYYWAPFVLTGPS